MKLIRFYRKTDGDVRLCEIRCGEEALEANIAIAAAEGGNGEYTVEDIEDPVTEPTQLDQIEAQVTYTALMTDTLLGFEEE